MKATKTLIASAIVAATLSAPAMAVEGLSANAAATSNYLWRGVTQSDDGAAVSGGIDYEASNGIYVGTWVSNVDFGDDTSYEMDFYGGYAGEVGDFSYDIGLIYYAYPDGDDLNFAEAALSVSYSFLTVGVSTMVYDDFADGAEDEMFYYFADAAFEVSEGLELGLHVGMSDGDTVEDWFGTSDYIDYNASLSKDGFTLMVSKTDLDDGNMDDLKAAITYSVDFDL
ncbi:TorF family putative porin [Neiella marina]|uniref:TorF family putative porin n=1 Tax=Neiella holothuriorum TaxID=2870530 RepID=A0ABS7EE90_9GAMM|nr:TorF family putative porin [Neiella holothuriorum]MBW8190012.1 TorF family putative porin [Neiella holothuriorum]